MNYKPELIGVGRFAGELVDELRRAGWDIVVVTTPPHYPGWKVKGGFANAYSSETEPSMKVVRCPLALPANVGGITRLLAPLSFAISSFPVVLYWSFRLRPDIIIATEPTMFAVPAALLSARFTSAASLLHVQDLEVEAAFAVKHLRGKSFIYLARCINRFLIAQFNQIVTISNSMRAALQADGARPERVTVIRNWVDLSKHADPAATSTFRQENGILVDVYLVLYAGNVGAKQALHLLVDAARQLVDRTDILIVIVGEGPMKARLEQNSPPNVRFLPVQPEVALADMLRSASLHVLPQDKDVADLVLPSKIGGMLASDVPLLVQAADGTELYKFLSGAATIVAPGDSKALADAIREGAKSDVATKLHRKRLAASLDKSVVLPNFVKLIEQVAAQKGQGKNG